MKRELSRRTFLFSSAGIAASTGARAEHGRRLFNGENLDGWYSFLREKGKNNDPDHVFRVHEGEIHVSGKEFGYISTLEEFENFDLTVDFKWGEKKWPPRENAKRDAGVLYAVTGPDMVWSRCLELQVQEGDTGDLWLIPGEGNAPAVTVLGREHGGAKPYANVVKWSDQEKPHGAWNTVRVRCRDGEFQHWVNGVVVMRGRAREGTRGRINLQSEGAEVFYRHIEVIPL